MTKSEITGPTLTAIGTLFGVLAYLAPLSALPSAPLPPSTTVVHVVILTPLGVAR